MSIKHLTIEIIDNGINFVSLLYLQKRKGVITVMTSLYVNRFDSTLR